MAIATETEFKGFHCGVCDPEGTGPAVCIGGPESIEATTFTELFTTTNPASSWAMHLLTHLEDMLTKDTD